MGIRIETHQDLATALGRLRRRSSESLATFIGTLAQDGGPIGEQVRTFIAGDNLVETMASLEERVDALRGPEFREDRDRVGEEVGQRLGYTLDAIETLVLPVDPSAAFDLLALLVQRDGDAMERCGDHHDSVASAFERAAGLVEQVARRLPLDEVLETLQQLIAQDDYGTRRPLAAVVQGIAAAG